jgi:hypothetical protein
MRSSTSTTPDGDNTVAYPLIDELTWPLALVDNL